MFLAGYQYVALITHPRGECVEGTMSGGFCEPVYHCTLVLVELGAESQRCSSLTTIHAAFKPEKQGLQVLPRILCRWDADGGTIHSLPHYSNTHTHQAQFCCLVVVAGYVCWWFWGVIVGYVGCATYGASFPTLLRAPLRANAL